MFHGDIIEMTSTAIAVREKALQPLGIYDQSICWGMWAANPHEFYNGALNPQYRHPNLIISPFHPSSWPFLIRIQIILENRKGALAEAAKLLEKNHLSILFAECTPTGFTHATWTVIAESTAGELDELRARKQQFDWDNQTVRIPPNKEYDEARDIASLIAARMLTNVRKLENAFRIFKKDSPPPPLLHEWRAQGDSHFLYNGDVVATEMPGPHGANLKYINSQIPDPVTANYMQRLAYFAIYGGGSHKEVPFQFKYAAKDRLMNMLSDVDFESGSFKLDPLPMPAIGTFNSEDKYLRLCPVTPEFLERARLSLISVPYKVEPQSTYNAKASQGLLRLICAELLAADVNLLHISNKWTSHAFYDEAGLIRFVADVEPGRYEDVKNRLASINADRPEHLKHVTLQHITISHYPQKKLFLSMHWGKHPRLSSIIELVKKIGAEEGFIEVVTVETYVDPPLEVVKSAIKECHAFLQVLYVDIDKEPDDINFRWVEREYDMAEEMIRWKLQLVDTVRATYDWWRQRDVCSKGLYPRSFRTDENDRDLSEKIRSAVKELAQKVEIQ